MRLKILFSESAEKAFNQVHSIIGNYEQAVPLGDQSENLRRRRFIVPESVAVTAPMWSLGAGIIDDTSNSALRSPFIGHFILLPVRVNGYDNEAIGFMIQGAKRKAKRRLRTGR